MRRKQATALIDDIRVVVAEGLESRDKALALHIIEQKLRNFGLQPLQRCQGAAHRVGDSEANGHVDNCSLCSPRWGWVGPVEVVS